MSIKDFQILNRLGEGSFSSVWKVKRLSDGKEYAMKKVKMNALSEKEKQNALNEVRILASINSPYIIGYKEAFHDDSSMTLCIIMEFASGGDLLNKITQHQKNRTFFPEAEIWAAFLQMLKGLKMLHDNKILHRDLKCANIFLTADGTAKLGDLNVSKIAKNDLAHTQTGTPYYASPEVWQDKPYDSKSDIWSLGCVVYEMAALKPPFRANDLQGLFKKVQKGVFDKIPSQYSKNLSEVIALCLQTSPKLRPSSEQLLMNPIVVKNSNSMDLQDDDESQMDLLGTIKMPRNPKALSNQLPKANYQSASVDLDEVLPTRGRRERSSSARNRDPQPLSRESGSVDNLREMSNKVQEKIIVDENPEKARIIRANPGLPPRKELDLQKRQISHQILNADGGKIPTPRNDQNSCDNALNNNYNNGIRVSREGNRPPLSRESPVVNSKQDELISKYQRIDPRLQQAANRYESPNSYRKLYGENSSDRKADYLLQKYNPDQYLQKPPTPSSKQNISRDQELMQKYNNVYKQGIDVNGTPDYMTPYSRQYSPSRNQGVYMQNQRNSPSQKVVDTRPIWWG